MKRQEKKELIDGLRDIVLERYKAEGIQVTTGMSENIWYALLGEYDRNGYKAAQEYARTAKLVKTKWPNQ